MKSAITYFAQALYTALTGDATLAGLVRVTAEWPDPNIDLPILVIGDDTISQWDDKLKGGQEIETVLHVFSDYAGWKQVNEICDAIIEAIVSENGAVSLAGASGCRVVSNSGRLAGPIRKIRENDGKILHAVATINFKIQEV